MAARYVLEQQILDPHPQVEITYERFLALVQAGATLTDARALEQGYELMLGNFMDMEMPSADDAYRCEAELQVIGSRNQVRIGRLGGLPGQKKLQREVICRVIRVGH